MLNNKKINIITGWSVFAFSFLVYVFTVSETINFWDSSELITCASGLQIGHSPGSPFFLILARIFAIFTINPQNISLAINLLSVIAASFTVFFLYHSIIIISLSIFKLKLPELNKSQIVICISASVLGALSFAFSSTFWTSAVETNIYSLSVFFISVCLWSMLRFYSDQDIPGRNRWVILCSLLLGLSVCVNLHCIFIVPVLVFIFYFGKYKFSYSGVLKTLLLSILLFIFVWGTVIFIPVVASKFELLFVNSFSFGYNSGLYFFIFLFIVLAFFGIYISYKKNKPFINFILTCFVVFISGYSVYGVILIRSSSNPPIDQNNPETIFNFISYINQNQYDHYPLWYGQQYNSSLDKNKPYIEGEPVYDTVNHKYKIVSNKPKANYKDRDKRLLPRMWSNQPEHIAAYQEWTGYKGDKIPPASVNIKFMFKYQFSHMYFRYFMWNFAGRQNDIQSHGGPINGNWISGINFIDNIRLGAVNKSPDGNKGKQTYYFLPLIMGVFGILLQFKKDKKFLLITGLLFILTGIAVSFYLNFHPYQARERDYLFIGSYFAFCIWIGLGVIWLYDSLEKYISGKYLTAGILLVTFLAVPLRFLAENYKNNNQSDNDLAYTFAYDLLNSCENNAILFTWGDNETFSLWYLQEVEKIRTDVSIINLSFLNTDWYIDQIIRKRPGSDGVLINADKDLYISGQRELLLIKETTSAFSEDIYFENTKEILEDYTYIFNRFIDILHENGFDRSHPEEYNNFRNYYSQIQPVSNSPSFTDFSLIVSNLSDPDYRSEFGLTEVQAEEIISDLYRFLVKQKKYPVPLNSVLNFVFSNEAETKIDTRLYEYPIDYFPVNNLMLRINRTQIIDKMGLSPELERYIVPRMEWSLDRESITKGDLMVLEIILANMWERPVYFSSTMNSRYFLGLDKYLYLEGFAYRLLPVETEISGPEVVGVNSSIMYKNLTEKFTWGKLGDKNIYYNENERKILTNIRNHLSLLAENLYLEGKLEESERVLDICVKYIPDEVVAYSDYSIEMVRGYYRLSKKSKAAAIGRIMMVNALNELEFYNSFSPRKQIILDVYKKRAILVIDELYNMANYYIDNEFIPEITEVYEKIGVVE
ncbi:MAG: DUF2723 domain-containing protein [Bacteroidales bacterium]|jgi:hypothetical protein|nr:DUF2723 domain-containing protein [Bacteroidales bacterium]